MAAISSASNAPTPELPPENWTLVFSNLDRQSAGRIASVSRVFQALSQHNDVWKPVHLREWQYREKWIGQEPANWKAYAQKVARAAHLALAIEYDDDEEYEQECRRRYSHYWQLGLVNEGILQLSPDHDKYEDSVLQSCIIAGEHQIASDLFESCTATPFFLEILLYIEEKKLVNAYDCYLAHRQDFITHDPKMGWWICKILQSEKSVVPERNKIFFPNIPKKSQIALLKASALIWMQRGLEKRAAISIECLARTLENSEKKDLDGFLEFFFKELEKRGFALSLPSSFYDLLEKLLHHSTFELDNPLTQALKNAIQQSPSLQTQVDLSGRFALLLSKIARKKRAEFLQAATQFISIFKQQEVAPLNHPFSYRDLLNIVQLVLTQKIDSEYSYFLQALTKHKLFMLEDQLAERGLKYQLELQQRLGQFSEAVVTYTKIFRLDNEAFDEIYDLLKKSEEACKKMTAVDSDFEEIQSARAYAFYKLGKYVDAARTLFKYRLDGRGSWKTKMCKQDLLAAITFSRVYDSVKTLEYFYLNVLSKLHDEPYIMHHNLAGCLLIRGFPGRALDHIATALQMQPNAPKAHAIKALALKALDMTEESKAAFRDAQELDPVMEWEFGNRYTDTELFVSPSNP